MSDREGQKLWIVEVGKYSDRRVIGVVSDPSGVDLSGVDDVRFSEFVIDEVEDIPAGYKPYTVRMSMSDGEVLDVYEDNMSAYLMQDEWSYNWYNEIDIQAIVIAESEEHAIKIVNERRAQLKASGIANRETGVVG